jgi:hypothetical protein
MQPSVAEVCLGLQESGRPWVSRRQRPVPFAYLRLHSIAEVCLGLQESGRPWVSRRQRPVPFAYPSPTLGSRRLPRPTTEWSALGVGGRGLSPSAEVWVSGQGACLPTAELKRRRSRIRSTVIPAFYSPNSAARSFIAPSTVWT